MCFFYLGQDYCASKFAAVGFHESLAHELLAEEVEGVKTTLVCPYIVDTGMFEGCKIRCVYKIITFSFTSITSCHYISCSLRVVMNVLNGLT